MPRINPESIPTKSDIVITSIGQFYLNWVLAVHEKAVPKDAPVCKSNVNGKIGIISVFRWLVSSQPSKYIYNRMGFSRLMKSNILPRAGTGKTPESNRRISSRWKPTCPNDNRL
jgi:hypothetical protein